LASLCSSTQRHGYGYLSPEEFIDLVKRHHCQGTSISFNEPTLLLEWSLEVFRLAHREGFTTRSSPTAI